MRCAQTDGRAGAKPFGRLPAQRRSWPQAADPELRTGRPTRAQMSEPRASGYHHLSSAAMPVSNILACECRDIRERSSGGIVCYPLTQS
jgi:hypothetical protein